MGQKNSLPQYRLLLKYMDMRIMETNSAAKELRYRTDERNGLRRQYECD